LFDSLKSTKVYGPKVHAFLSSRPTPPVIRGVHLDPIKTLVKAAPSAALLPLASIVAGAVTSIAASAKRIEQYEKKHSQRHKLTLQEAYPEMTKRKQPEYTVTFPDEKRRKTNNNNRAIVVAPKRRNNSTGQMRSRTVMAPLSGSIVMTKSVVPRFNMNGQGTIVRNTERFSNIILAAAGAYAGFNVALIPQVPGWLAPIGDLYSKYRWHSLRIIYVPKCPTSTSGTVGMCITYDRQDQLPTTLDQLSRTNKAILFPPYAGYGGASMLNNTMPSGESIYIDVDVSKFDKIWYHSIQLGVLTALAPAVQTGYVPCTVQVGHADGPLLATPAGDMYLQYAVEFIEPIDTTMNQ
jgi:hypothetical protein